MSSRISSKPTPVNDFFCLFVEGENDGENCFTELIICLNKCPLSCFCPHFLPLWCWLLSVPHRQADTQQCAKPQNQVFTGSRAVKLSDRQVVMAVQPPRRNRRVFRFFKGGTYDWTLIQTARCIQVVKAGKLCACIHLSGGQEGNTNNSQSGLGTARQTHAARQINHSPLTTRPGRASGATQKEWII